MARNIETFKSLVSKWLYTRERKEDEKMRKILLATPLLVTFTLFIATVSINGVPPVTSPYIACLNVPATITDPTLTVGERFNVTIYTDYDGSDVWSFEFTLTYDPNILNGVDLYNGDLITGGHPAYFMPGDFDNVAGKLSLTGAFTSDFSTTSGPGTMANVTFEVVGYGISDIIFGKSYPDTTVLKSPDDNIIDALFNPDQIGHGYFRNHYPGDVDGDLLVGSADAGVLNGAYGKSWPDPLYDREADFDLDGLIGSADAGILNGAYGITYPWP